jgi:hypothetical protein
MVPTELVSPWFYWVFLISVAFGIYVFLSLFGMGFIWFLWYLA